jgi:hypothetical protein
LGGLSVILDDLSRLTSAEEAEYKLLGDRWCGISWFQ